MGRVMSYETMPLKENSVILCQFYLSFIAFLAKQPSPGHALRALIFLMATLDISDQQQIHGFYISKRISVTMPVQTEILI